jgi:hypothetical protein
MKLLFINNILIDFNYKNQNKNGGIEYCNTELVKRLSLFGHDVSVVSKVKKKQKKFNIVNIPFDYLNQKNFINS